MSERTEEQINASRENGKQSTGPKTEEGRQRCRQAATKHGLKKRIQRLGVVALAGSLLGSALARIILFAWQAFAKNADGTPLFPVELGMDLVVMAAVLATIVGLLAAIMPALRAARLDPVVAIRG